MNNTETILVDEPINKLLLKYSVPAIVGMLVNALYNMVDRVFIGNIPNIGAIATVGLGVTMPFTTILTAFGMLVGIGSVTVISIKLGQNKKCEATDTLGNAISLSIIIGIFVTILGLILSEKILIAFGASSESLKYANEYIRIILIGSTFNILSYTLNCNIRGDGNPKLAALIMIVGCTTNIILDYILIFIFNLGISGAAIATIISQMITTIWSLYYYKSGRSYLKISSKNIKLEGNTLKMLLPIGLSPFCMQIASCFVQIVSNNSLKYYGGDLAIGAMSTTISIMLIFYMPLFGLSEGSQPIIGYNYGYKNYARCKNILNTSIVWGIALMSIGIIVIQIWAVDLVKIFNNDLELVNVTSSGIKKFSLMMPIVPVSILGSNYIQSIGKAKEAMLLSLLRQVIILIPIILLLPKFLGLNGIWYSQPVADFIAVIITLILILKEVDR
ncbi:MATE family efflux transporter [Clostridium frigidicarnis]|uniref:Multidrug export protein MepA n=1 Tax=Clostridium frigidicarnis TaxID=84698 RepID=A0A1I1ARB5_9CLOT|nr:MATE family efflux transporter [Clostridium frigidicarnis]SFB40571.1 putative efflux protein, MATE family [Clostridium frigidicarnis]